MITYEFKARPAGRILQLLLAGLSLLPMSSRGASPSAPIGNSGQSAISVLPRYEKLPLFNPHRGTFTCISQERVLSDVDPQADLWFQQALALDDPDVYSGKRDYATIYRLYAQAAERGYWKAMLNLAALILSDYAGIPEHNPETAIRWVEKAMRLGVPDAYDLMGTLHQNGIVHGGNATSAYAFFQRAADMGSPAAMTLLGNKLAGTYDDPRGEFWGNLPVATDMLKCAMAQGYAPAAYKLAFIFARPHTPEARGSALTTFHEGVKLGCAKCAKALAVQFDGVYLGTDLTLVDRADNSRADRYKAVGAALEHYGDRMKLPNLDTVLPLPPAPLPEWGGERRTLIDGAKAVTPEPRS
jgi:hypothetical protein